jgi:hypothetical protein
MDDQLRWQPVGSQGADYPVHPVRGKLLGHVLNERGDRTRCPVYLYPNGLVGFEPTQQQRSGDLPSYVNTSPKPPADPFTKPDPIIPGTQLLPDAKPLRYRGWTYDAHWHTYPAADGFTHAVWVAHLIDTEPDQQCTNDPRIKQYPIRTLGDRYIPGDWVIDSPERDAGGKWLASREHDGYCHLRADATLPRLGHDSPGEEAEEAVSYPPDMMNGEFVTPKPEPVGDPRPTPGMSIGRLKMMSPEKRAVAIAQLPIVTKHRLAHKASWVASKLLQRAQEMNQIIDELTASD